MEEFVDNVPTGEGNPFLQNVCYKLFEKTGEITYHNLAERFGMPEQDFDKLYAPEHEEEKQMEQ